jgi:hypothetical protein
MPKLTRSIKVAQKLISQGKKPSNLCLNIIISELWQEIIELEKENDRLRNGKFMVLLEDLKRLAEREPYNGDDG